MDKKYIELFKELTKATAVSAEQVMDYDREKKDEQGLATAQLMRDEFNALHDKMSAEDFNGNLNKADYARLLVGTYIIANQLQDRITALKQAVAGYQTDIIPKLDKIIAAETDEAAQEIANQEFVIKQEETNI